jgi:hypothetical protein
MDGGKAPFHVARPTRNEQYQIVNARNRRTGAIGQPSSPKNHLTLHACLKGSMISARLYNNNTPLSAAQINAIYLFERDSQVGYGRR